MKRYTSPILMCAFALLLARCGSNGGGSGGGGGDTTPTTVTSGLVYQLDAATYDGSAFPATGCATLTWTDLISALTGTLTGFAGCGSTSGWNGTGATADPYRLVLDGTNDRVDLGTGTLGTKLAGASAVTIDFWVRYSTLESGKYDNNLIYVSVDGAKAGLWINFRGDGANAGKLLIAGRSQTTDSFLEKTGASSFASGTWIHLTGIFNFGSGELNLAYDGSLETASSVGFTAATYTQGTATASDSLTYYNAATDYLNGDIAYVGVYNRELSPAEISQNCTALKDRFPSHTCN
ncbi:MAG: LamG domain-containing protein [Bdellovibrionales bacterium]|nr:LamG domain-containing protein [Bdellovibrionales bacterium]